VSYLVLARKYRPGIFADLVGQEVVARTLQGAIEEDRVGHAYLFTGPRGTGKTTTARLFAKALNCVNGPTPNPCGVCGFCEGIEKGSDPDLIEMDAASNRRIEDVRELRENVAYAPMRARFKVYIVDEVHMMTKEAFNALLKTLEEPPRHVKFLLATTDPQKVPATILSRCQILRLSPMTEAVITARLDDVFGRENVRAEAGVTAEIARRARGGMRDALSMADQLLSLVGAEPKLADMERLAAEGGAELADRILGRLVASDRAGVIETLPVGEGGEAELLGALLDRLRAVLLVGLLGPETPLVQLEPPERAALAARAREIGLPRLEAWTEELILARERMARLPAHGRVLLEVVLLDLARAESGLSLAELERRLLALEARLAGAGSPANAPPANAPPANAPPANAPPANAPPANAPPANAPPRAASRAPDPDLVPRPPAAPAAGHARGAAPAPVRVTPQVESDAPRVAPSSERAAPASPREMSAPPRVDPRSVDTRSVGTRGVGTRGVPREIDEGPSSRDAGDDGSGSDFAADLEREDAPHSDRPRTLIAGNADAWERFLTALAKTSASLSETLRLRGKLVDLTNGRALIQMSNLRETERAAALDAENQRRCQSVFSAVLGAPVTVVLEDQSVAKKSRDAYTGKVAELFGGRIEDDA
jgi:DNA polymerase-3 subunit gamma/tau